MPTLALPITFPSTRLFEPPPGRAMPSSPPSTFCPPTPMPIVFRLISELLSVARIASTPPVWLAIRLSVISNSVGPRCCACGLGPEIAMGPESVPEIVLSRIAISKRPVPSWLVLMLPAADRLARSHRARGSRRAPGCRGGGGQLPAHRRDALRHDRTVSHVRGRDRSRARRDAGLRHDGTESRGRRKHPARARTRRAQPPHRRRCGRARGRVQGGRAGVFQDAAAGVLFEIVKSWSPEVLKSWRLGVLEFEVLSLTF